MALNKPQVEVETDVIETEVAVVEETTAAITEVAVPVVSKPAAPALTNVGSVEQFKAKMAEAGMEGLEIDGFSFESITLPGEGFFQLASDEDSNLGKSIDVLVLGTRARYVVKQEDSQDSESFFSYDKDGSTKTDGTDATAIIAQWAADYGDDNYRPVIRKYLDVTVQIVGGEEDVVEDMAGDLAMLSVPPTSVSKFSGVIMRMQMRNLNQSETVINCSVGKKRKAGSGSFYPWVFAIK